MWHPDCIPTSYSDRGVLLVMDLDKPSSEVTKPIALVIGHRCEPKTLVTKANGYTTESQVKAY